MNALMVESKRRRGIAVILTTLSMFVIVPMVGLGIDVSTLYIIRAKLYEAADAAALAGTRALSQGADGGTQKSNAQTVAVRYFNANFPAGFWGASNIILASPAVNDATVPNYRTVSISATVQAPLYFLRILGPTTSTINVNSQAARRDALVMLVLDRSSSMNYVFQGSTACNILKPDAIQFLTNFAPGRDMVGLVVFGSTAYVSLPRTNFDQPDANGNTIASLINQITCTGNTNTAEGMEQAYKQLQAINSTARANVIVLMTDGRPNGFTGDYTNNRISPGSCDPGNAPLIGVLAQWAGGPNSTGTTAGLMNYATNSITNTNEGPTNNSGGCNFAGDLKKARNDLSGMPATDIYGNSASGPYSAYNPAFPYNGAYASLTGVSSPQMIEVASTNVLDNEGTKIRTDATLKPAIYTIALEGNSVGDPPDTLILRKLANDPSMENDPNSTAQAFYQQQKAQPQGFFADAPDPSQLFAAFNTIATQIVIRLSR
jgi:Flp pilus assembly protein TadG